MKMAVVDQKDEQEQILKALKDEIESRKATFNQEIERRSMETRQAASKVAEDQALLNAQRKEFNEILSKFQKDQKAFEKERKEIEETKRSYEEMKAKLNRFIVIVRRESEGL